MELAVSIGISITEFWEITPYELYVYAKGYGIRQEEEFKLKKKLAIYQSYLTSRWVWEKKVDIDKFLGEEEQHKEMTDEEMLEKVKILNQMFGGEIVYGTKE